MLYGRIKTTRAEVPEYFSDARKSLEAMGVVNQVQKEAEQAALEAIGDLPDLGPNDMFMNYSDTYSQMAKWLKDNKDELLKTEEGRKQYQTLLDQSVSYANSSKEYTTQTNPLLKRNLKIARSGINPQEWEQLGLMDSRTEADYVAWTSSVDTARSSVTVKDGEWVITDDEGDHAFNDPKLFDLSFWDESKYLKDTPMKPPRNWWSLNHNDSQYDSRSEAVEWTEAAIANDGRSSRDALRWAEQNGVWDEGVTADQVQKEGLDGRREEAIKAYAEASVPEGWTKEDPTRQNSTPSPEDLKKEAFESSFGDVAIERGQPTPPATQGAVTGSTYSFPNNYLPNMDTSVWPEPVKDEDGNIVTIKATAIKRNVNSQPMFSLVTNSGEIPLDPNEPSYSIIKQQIDRAMSGTGKGFEDILNDMSNT